jgi:hypothetical protein
MINKQFFALLAVPLLALAACGGEAEAPVESDDSATATGDVLGGSISDAMLPLDEVRSQSPSAPRRVTTPSGPSGEEAAPASETPEAEAASAAPAPEIAPPPPAEE